MDRIKKGITAEKTENQLNKNEDRKDDNRKPEERNRREHGKLRERGKCDHPGGRFV